MQNNTLIKSSVVVDVPDKQLLTKVIHHINPRMNDKKFRTENAKGEVTHYWRFQFQELFGEASAHMLMEIVKEAGWGGVIIKNEADPFQDIYSTVDIYLEPIHSRFVV